MQLGIERITPVLINSEEGSVETIAVLSIALLKFNICNLFVSNWHVDFHYKVYCHTVTVLAGCHSICASGTILGGPPSRSISLQNRAPFINRAEQSRARHHRTDCWQCWLKFLHSKAWQML